MEKNILVYLNGVPTVNFTVTKQNTVSDVKNILKQYPYDKATFFANKDTQIPVFDTDKYDKTSLESVWKQMNNSEIKLIKEEKDFSYIGMKKLNKDELIHLITILERDIRKDYEKYTVPPNAEEFYYKIKKLFKDNIGIVSIPNSNQLNMFISTNPDIVDLNPITLQTEIDMGTLEDAFKYYPDIYPNVKDIDDVLVKNIKQVIAINKTENKAIHDSVLFDIRNKRNTLVLRMFPDKKEFKLKNLLEIVYRLRREKNINQEEELYRSFKSHIDENGTLFLEVKFDYFTPERLGEGGDEIETSEEGEEGEDE